MAGAAEIPDDAGSEVEIEAPESDSEGNDAEISEVAALDSEVRDQADEYVASDDSDDDSETEKPAKREKKASDKSEAKGEDDEEASAKKAPQKKETGAQKRIQQLVERQKQAEHRARQIEHQAKQAEAQFRQYQQHYQRQFEETQKRLAEREREHAVAMKELEIIRQREQEAQEAQLDPLEKAMRIERRKAISETEGRLKQELAKRDQELAQFKKQFNERIQQEETEKRVQHRIRQYETNADSALSNLFKGLPAEKAQALSPRVKTQILNYAAAHNIMPEQAAKAWDRIAHEYVLAKMRLKAAPNGEAVKKGGAIPPGNPAGRKPTKGNGTVTQAQAKKMGHANALEATIRSNPPSWARS